VAGPARQHGGSAIGALEVAARAAGLEATASGSIHELALGAAHIGTLGPDGRVGRGSAAHVEGVEDAIAVRVVAVEGATRGGTSRPAGEGASDLLTARAAQVGSLPPHVGACG